MSKMIMDDDEDDDSAGWLTSYADLMTLIACFFILMMAFANYDPPGFQKKTKVIAEHFKGDSKELKDGENIEKKEVNNSLKKLKELQKEIEAKQDVKKMTKTKVVNNSLILHFDGNILFRSGEYRIRPLYLAVVDSVISLIKDKDPNYRIIVEGHTDGAPLGTHPVFTSNWSLSGARASSVAERFEIYGFAPDSIRVLALGSSKPFKPHRDKEGELILKNLKLNRRVVLKVLGPTSEKEAVKMGLGVYFDRENGSAEDE
jgi:chemotaxis protein MotB